MTLEVDHLVVAAATLEQGAAWCEAMLGVAPGPGGTHPLMGTHNRLLTLSSPGHPRAYLEIIAVDPAAPAPGRPRWFGLDDPALQDRLKTQPGLLHWVARTSALAATREAALAHGIDPGPAVEAGRATPHGPLRWKILVRDDGRLLCDGAWPTLIEWAGAHPADRMPASGVELRGLELRGLPAGTPAWLGLPVGVALCTGPAGLRATLQTPRGTVTLASV